MREPFQVRMFMIVNDRRAAIPFANSKEVVGWWLISPRFDIYDFIEIARIFRDNRDFFA